MNFSLIVLLLVSISLSGCAQSSYIASGNSEISMELAISEVQQSILQAENRGCVSISISTGIGLSQSLGIGIGEGFTLSENCPECNDILTETSKSRKLEKSSSKYSVTVLMHCPIQG